MSRTGGLRVTVETPGSFPSLALRLEILDQRMQLQRRAKSDQEIELSPGAYVVSLALPDGTRAVRGVEVRSGRTTQLRVDWQPPRFGGMDARSGIAGAKAIGGKPPRGFAQRFVTYSTEQQGFIPANEAPAVDVDDYASDRGVVEVSMRLCLSGGSDQLRFVQLAALGQLMTVALPLAPNTDASQCSLRVAVSATKVVASVQIGGSPEADLVGQFVAGGELEQVASLPSEAEELLYRKMSHPLGAAVGGYALLRLNALALLHDWPSNLARRFPWLPDGPVITGEQALRNGRSAEALEQFCESTERGLPVFTDGYSLLLARLRRFTRGAAMEGLTPGMQEKVAQALKRVDRWALFTDFSELLLTLQAVVPFDQFAEPGITRAGKWRLFRIPLGTAKTQEDFWTDSQE